MFVVRFFSISVFRYFQLVVDVFPSVLVCDPDMFSLNRCIAIEQRYATVDFNREDRNR